MPIREIRGLKLPALIQPAFHFQPPLRALRASARTKRLPRLSPARRHAGVVHPSHWVLVRVEARGLGLGARGGDRANGGRFENPLLRDLCAFVVNFFLAQKKRHLTALNY